MRTQRCPSCEFIYIGDEGPGDSCPECGSAWSDRGPDELSVLPPLPAGAPQANHNRRPGGAVSLVPGLILGGIAGLVAGAIAARQFVTVQNSGEYRELLSRSVRAEQQLASARADAQSAKADSAESARALAAAQQELQSQRGELDVLRELNRSTHDELSRVVSRLEEMDAEILALRRAASQSYVRDWLLGPLRAPGGDSGRFPAPAPVLRDELVGGLLGDVQWRAHSSEENRINLAQFFDYRQKAVCFAASWVHSDQDRDVVLSIGSDDGVCVWINGGKVHEHGTNRAASPGQDRVDARLAAGWNELLVAVDNTGSGDWDLYFEFLTAADSRPLRLYSTNAHPVDDAAQLR